MAPPRRRLSGLVVLALAALLLASCSGSKAGESRKAQDRDATRGAVLPGLQATKTVKDYFPPTPTPDPTMTPMASIASLTLTSQVGGSGEAIGSITRASAGQQVYAVAQLSDLRTGETVVAKWYNSTGAEMGEVSKSIDSNQDRASIALAYTVDSSAYGNCWVEIWVNDTRMNSLVFSAG